MRILIVLTYYRPHISGLTIYVQRLARALVARGHQVTVLTSQYDKALPSEEIIDGVKIVRAGVLLRISKGVIMPTFGFLAWKLVLKNDIIHLHLPQFDAAGVALRGRLLKKPTVITYHCDLKLPASLFNRIVNQAVHLMNFLAGIFTHRISAYTEDFANHSPYLRFFSKKVDVILPPVELPTVRQTEIESFKLANNPEIKMPVIGMATRFASEKGVEVLLDALPQIIDRHPNALVLYAGQYEDVLGEDAYLHRLMPIIREYISKGQWKFLGILNPLEMAAFYPNLDVLVVPSLNSTETFGLVQIEAMLNGVPTVASNLPGVRQPPILTGMGEVTAIGDADDLANGIQKIFSSPDAYKGNPDEIARTFAPDMNAAAYERIYEDLLKKLQTSKHI